MSEAPDLDVVDLYAELGAELGSKAAKREVPLCPLDQPLAQMTGKQSWFVTADLVRRDTPLRAIPLKPFDRAACRHSKTHGRGSSRHPVSLNRQNQSLSQIRRYGSDHANAGLQVQQIA